MTVYLIIAAVVCIVLGFHHSARSRVKAECAFKGHRWDYSNESMVYGEFTCRRCGKRS